jgi:hypothetical protein
MLSLSPWMTSVGTRLRVNSSRRSFVEMPNATSCWGILKCGHRWL